MQTNTIKSYLYQQYQRDMDLQAFVDAYNTLTQGYVDWCNQINLPIYTGLSGGLLDLIGAGVYGLKRPSVGTISGSVYNNAVYDVGVYGSGTSTSGLVSDDIYKRILTWKLYRGDGVQFTIPWLKKRLKRFLIGANGVDVDVSSTSEISVKILPTNEIDINIHYPTDFASATLLKACIDGGLLDMPLQYTVVVTTI